MIPITLPTDNLYKFIALFGLGILIFGIMNMSKLQSELTQSKIRIEKIEKEIFDTIHYFDIIDPDFEHELHDNILKYKCISNINSQLDEIKNLVNNDKKIPIGVKGYVNTKIDIIEIKTLSIRKQELIDCFLIGLSIVLMSIGFFLWYRKDQRWKDIRQRNGHVEKNNTE